MKIHRILLSFAAALLIGLAAPNIASACPNCSGAVAEDESKADSGRLAAGYSKSILFMMAMPFALIGTGTVLIVRQARRGGIPPL